MSEQAPTPREYWIAIRPSRLTPPNVFGPYSLTEATEYREEWLTTYPSSAAISAVYHADSRDLANQHAHFYLPK
ncbi:MAG: hypothetical protein JWN70_2995 [Planctomycetaceae bacterium]|nr:hypothetical protein [Planctomycetaceae bacterium]